MFLRIILCLIPIYLTAQHSDDICGIWVEEEQDSHIKIYKTNNNLYEGKIVWLAQPLNENGEIKLDKDNPNPQLRKQTIEGLVIINNLLFTEHNTWSKGLIYDARSGKTYSLNANLKDENTLFMRGYIGFSLIGKTTTWTRAP
tara:strand:+ start:1112 stop:1540 length:429 start_codon:yes stop_codon:yes gene_type:complete